VQSDFVQAQAAQHLRACNAIFMYVPQNDVLFNLVFLRGIDEYRMAIDLLTCWIAIICALHEQIVHKSPDSDLYNFELSYHNHITITITIGRRIDLFQALLQL